jgi:hypothetical protein
LDPALGTRLNLAVCEERLGRLAVAWQLLQSLMTALPADDPRTQLVSEKLEALEPRVPRITLESAGTLPADLKVKSDSLELTESSFGVPIPINPGTSRFEVSAPGRAKRSFRVALAEGESRVLRIEAPPEQPLTLENPGSAPAPTPTTPPDRSYRTWGTVSLGAAASSLVAGLVTGYAGVKQKQTMDAACDSAGCTSAGMRAAETGKTLTTASTIFFTAGVALAAGGVVLLLAAPDSSTGGAGGRTNPVPLVRGIAFRTEL